MERKTIRRYLIFLAVLVLCAGAAWYFTNTPETPQGNVVLAAAELLQKSAVSGKGL